MLTLRPSPAPAGLVCRMAVVCLVSTTGLLLVPCEASAQPRRARLSRDLVERIDRGDTERASVIVTASQDRVDRIAARHGLRVAKRLENGALLEVPQGELAAVAEDPEVDQLSGNHIVLSQAALTNEAIGADQVQAGGWARGVPGLTGAGVGVAVIDSGVARMPELRNRIIASVDFTDSRGLGRDLLGHGTHVAGIIAGAAANRSDETLGVAPGANIISLKVLDEHGRGTTADVIEAIDYAVKYSKRYNIRVINLSLGGPVMQSWRDDPLCQAVERAYRAGLVVVASAGNLGKLADGREVFGGITNPGVSPFAITVGALNTKGTAYRSDDVVATYSSKGPTRFDRLIKPDLVAPGNRILGLAAPGSTLVREHPELVIGSGNDARLELSGTSMAAAVVSGAAAQMLEAFPRVSPVGVRFRFQYSATRESQEGVLVAGAGSLNVMGSLSLGVPEDLVEPLVGGEALASAGLVFAHRVLWQGVDLNAKAVNILWGNAVNILWGNADNILWGNANNILWGNAGNILWGNAGNILWGNAGNILWGNADNILWGNAGNILWGNADNILWGNADNILWGNADNILWGNADNILWGNADNILWGNADNILWGNADNILWGNANNILWGNALLPTE